MLFHLLVFCIDARWGAPNSDLSRNLYEMTMPVEAMCDRLDVLDPDGFCTSCPRHGQRPVVLPPECFKGFIRIIQKKYRTTYARGTSCQVLIRVLLARLVRTEVLSKWKNQVLQKGCEVCFRFVLADGVPEGRVYGRRLVFVSVRTIKRHHHQASTSSFLHGACASFSTVRSRLIFLQSLARSYTDEILCLL